MIKIVTDSSCLFGNTEAQKRNLTVLPLQVTIKDKTYLDYFEIDSHKFVEIINEGNLPKSSQPPVGMTMEAYANNDEIVSIHIADGLSGTYQSCLQARNTSDHPERIHVINSRTLCGPMIKLVDVALTLSEEGKDAATIVSTLEKYMDTAISFLIPMDFDYLKRNGRLTPLAATISGFLKLVAITCQSSDGKRLDKFGVAKSTKQAGTKIIEDLVNKGYDESYIFYVSHGCNEELADQYIGMIKTQWPTAEVIKILLSPGFITQGGPGCIAIQAIKRTI
jgi:DegV family protein with EDD domain